jgi:glycine cleavage system aminomethyltransferase T
MTSPHCILPVIRSRAYNQDINQVGVTRNYSKHNLRASACGSRQLDSRLREKHHCMIFIFNMVQRWSRLRAIACRRYMGMSAKVRISSLRDSNEVSDASTVASHQNVRQSAGLFDVGHMVQSQ